MKSQNKKLVVELIAFGVLGFLMQKFFLQGFVLKVDLLTNIVTFLSIAFGFYVTSFSIFSTSEYVSSLYGIVDGGDKSQTLLHSLVFKYKVGMLAVLVSILYIISLILLLNQSGTSDVYFSSKSSYFLVSVFLFNLFYGYKMFGMLAQIIMQESKRSKS